MHGGLVQRFSVIHRQSGIYLDRRLRTLDISVGQFLYIVCVVENPGLSQEQMAGLLRIDKGAVARTVKELVGQGFLRRERDARDRRQYRLFASERAEEVYQDINKVTQEWEQRITKDLTPAECEALEALLDKVVASLE